MTETGSTVERLDWIRKHHERFPTDVCPSDVVVSCSDIAALLAVVEAAQEFSDAERAMYVALVEAYNGEGDRRRVCHDAEDAALAKLRERLVALHSQASDEGEA